MKARSSVNPVPSRPAVTALSALEHPKSRFLEGLSKTQIGSILAAATHRRYLANSVVINQGDPADHFFLLAKGCARLFYITQEGRKVLLRWLPAGEILGGVALLSTPSSYLVSTEMVKDSSVFVWHRNMIRELTARYPKLLENALPFASDHLTWFLAAHMALTSNNARERLAQVVLSLAQGIGHSVSGGVRLDITNEQLANAANITTFTASRLLSEWQRNGAVSKGRGSLILCASHQLFLHQI
jgi:CRP/FNR family transcriptional regulator, nitrogen oxide reductase regulator